MSKSCFKELDYLYVGYYGNTVRIEEMKKFVDVLSTLGFTGIFLDLTSCYRPEGEPYFAYPKGIYTKEFVRELDEYCKSKNIELKPDFQVLGHLSMIGKYKAYNDFMETPEALLVDDERTYELIDKMFKTMREMFSTNKVHLGLDEAFGVGSGKHLKRYGVETRFDIMTRHISRVLEIAKKYGFTEYLAWPDMFLRHCFLTEEDFALPTEEFRAKVKGKIPQGVTFSNWDYDFPKQNGALLKKEMDRLFKLTDNVSFTTTNFKWHSLAPDNLFSIRLFNAQIDALRGYNLDKFIVSEWGGDASMFSILPTLYFLSEYAYGRAKSYADLDKAKFKKLFGVDFDGFLTIDLLNKPLRCDEEVLDLEGEYTLNNNQCGIYFYNDILIGMFDKFVAKGSNERYRKIYEKIKAADGGPYQYIFDFYVALAKALSLKAELGLQVKELYDKGDKEGLRNIALNVMPTVIADCKAVQEKFKVVFERENSTHFFTDSYQKMGGMVYRLGRVKEILLAYADGKIPEIAELNAERLMPEIFYHNSTQDNCELHGYDQIVTAGYLY